MTSDDDILTAANLHKSYGKGPARVQVLRGLDLAVRRGEFLAVMGPSGCGKSTLLHVLGLMTRADDGMVAIDGQDLRFGPSAAGGNGHGTMVADERRMLAIRRTKIGFVFQRFNLISVLSAADNVAISLSVRGVRDGGQVGELFESLGVAHLKARKPGQMSIGEQQRLAVVRALAHRPAILLADEPTGNLDSANSAALLGIFRDLNRSRGQTIVMITHSAEAAACADRIVQMKDGEIARHS